MEMNKQLMACMKVVKIRVGLLINYKVKSIRGWGLILMKLGIAYIRVNVRVITRRKLLRAILS